MNLSRIPVGWPEDKEAIPFGALAAIFASAVTPTPEASDPEDLAFHLNLVDYENRLRKAAQEGALVIRNPVTWEPLPCWMNPDETIVRFDDLKAHLERIGSVIELVPLRVEQPLPPSATHAQPASDMTEEEVEEAAAWADAVNKAEGAGMAEKQNWRPKQPARFSAYGPALHRLLCAEWQKGRLRHPTAREVLEMWSIAKPPEVFEVMQDGFKYLDGTGSPKAVSLHALKEAISRMTEKHV